MKLNKNKAKGKGKVHPSPSSSSTFSSSSSPFPLTSNSNDPISSLNMLLPAAILTLISALSLQDREVLAYMITHSLESSPVHQNPSAPSIIEENQHNRKPKSKKYPPHHKSPCFDCNCFDCYTTYWFRWDSSPCRELIHQAIEAFEEHLAISEQAKKSTTKNRRREKDRTTCRQTIVSEVTVEDSAPEIPPESKESLAEGEECQSKNFAGEESAVVKEENGIEEGEERQRNKLQQPQEHKGLARKVLPDVIGLFNSRLWSLWGPNV